MHNWQLVGHHWQFYMIFGAVMLVVACWGLRIFQPIKYSRIAVEGWRHRQPTRRQQRKMRDRELEELYELPTSDKHVA
jgi:hypothetical protein